MTTRARPAPDYGARHSIPPGVRLRLGFGMLAAPGLQGQARSGGNEFRPTIVHPDPTLAVIRQMLAAKARYVERILDELIVEADGDEYLACEIELLKTELDSIRR